MRVAPATAVAVVLLALPSAGVAQTQLPVGSADGVRIVREKGAIVVVFTARAAKLWKRVAGRRVSVDCRDLPEPDGAPLQFVTGSETILRAPRRGRRLRTGEASRIWDLCEVRLKPRRTRRQGIRPLRSPVLATIPITQRGAVYIDEKKRAQLLQGVLLLAKTKNRRLVRRNFRTAADLDSELSRLPRFDLVPLPSPSSTPPPGPVGYYSDGAKHAAAVMLSASGRRLFLEYDADEVVRTNVLRYLGGG
jgi:hypothetical protein